MQLIGHKASGEGWQYPVADIHPIGTAHVVPGKGRVIEVSERGNVLVKIGQQQFVIRLEVGEMLKVGESVELVA